ncbi:hypothetical protein PG993_002453 [Apiospora rasikravindrae]|uniref:DJ-1/PfpI domain-containing protein n=1 Tax=Apiospora rasikravindrae TaxID=990691 RepID=A0ABR1TWX9_9PEZI
MADNKSSAINDEPIDVLFVLQEKFNLLDFAGPFEALTWAQHNKDDPCQEAATNTALFYVVATKAFECTIAGAEPKVLSEQGAMVGSQITYKEAYERLNDFDVVVIVGGDSDHILNSKAEPLGIIKAYSELQQKDSARERTLLSICTGALYLAEAGVLSGLSATTHPDYMTAFENLCSHSAVRDAQERTDVDEEARYVVNNLRFEIGEEDENPYVRRKSDAQETRRPSNARIMVDEECANEVARILQHTWVKGKVVDGLDV